MSSTAIRFRIGRLAEHLLDSRYFLVKIVHRTVFKRMLINRDFEACLIRKNVYRFSAKFGAQLQSLSLSVKERGALLGEFG